VNNANSQPSDGYLFTKLGEFSGSEGFGAGEDEVVDSDDTKAPGYRQLITFYRDPIHHYRTTKAQDTFHVRFRVFSSSDIRVTVNGIETTDFTFTGTTDNYEGFSGGLVVLDTAVSDSDVAIWLDPTPARTTDLSGTVTDLSINEEFEKLWQQDRSLRLFERRFRPLAHSASKTLTAFDSGNKYLGPGPYTLPSASAGLWFDFSDVGSRITINRAGSDKIVDDGTEYDAFVSGAAGSALRIQSPIGTKWYVLRKIGTWTGS
jgi:hypothetical protein